MFTGNYLSSTARELRTKEVELELMSLISILGGLRRGGGGGLRSLNEIHQYLQREIKNEQSHTIIHSGRYIYIYVFRSSKFQNLRAIS
jgi:hypothetical protein